MLLFFKLSRKRILFYFNLEYRVQKKYLLDFKLTLSVTFRPLVKQTTTRNLYITIYIYFLDGRLCEVGAVRRAIRIVRRWGLNFSMSGDDGRDIAHSVTTREVSWTAESIFSVLFCSIRRPYITFKLPRRDKDTLLRLRNFFPISGDWDVSLPLIWNGLCDRRRAEITVMQFTGHSLPVHHWSGTFTLSHIISRAHLRDFFRLLAIGMCHFRYLWNGRCDHHWAEITIMQFIGQFLPVHHFLSENFYLVSYCEPSCILH